ncbi:voltage-gated hydrogen channel 1-like isoform X2 [Liolophura sinensis]
MEGFQKLQEDLEKVIEKDDSNSSVTTDSEELKTTRRTCREKTRYILQTTKFQIAVILLVILDCLFVICELLLDLRVFTLEEGHVAPEVFHYFSLSILAIFMVEIAVRLYVLRLEFLKHKLEVFDAIVVVVSFILDIVFRNSQGPESGVGLLVVLRLWRVTRILNGIVMSVKKQSEKKVEKEHRLREACEQELSKFRDYCANQEREIEYLRGLLRKHGIEVAERVPKPAPVQTINVVAEVNEIIDKSSSPEIKEKRDSVST